MSNDKKQKLSDEKLKEIKEKKAVKEKAVVNNQTILK
jgi:hypothetical protein